MNTHETDAMFQSTIRDQLEEIGLAAAAEAILATECVARLGVPLDTPLGNLSDEQLETFGEWVKQIGEEMLREGEAVLRLAAMRRERDG